MCVVFVCVCVLVCVCLCVAAAVTSLTGVLHPAVTRLLRLGHPSKSALPMRDWGLVSDNIADSSVDFWHYAKTTNIQIFLSLSLIFLFLCFSCFHFDFLSCKKPSKSLAWSFVKADCRFSGRFMVLLNPNYHCFCCYNCCCCCW